MRTYRSPARALLAALAFARNSQPVAGVHAGGNLDAQAADLPAAPLAAAGRAGIPDDRPRAAALAAGPAQGEEPLPVHHLSLAAAGLAGRARAGLGPGAAAVRAVLEAGNGDLLLAAQGGVEKVDLEIEAQVGPPAPGGARPARPAEEVPERKAEERSEDVLEIGEDLRVEAAETLGAAEAGMAEPVVAGALLLVGQDGVGLGRFLELLLGVLVAGVAIGVMLHGELAVGLLDLGLTGLAPDPEHLVVVALLHRSAPDRRTWIDGEPAAPRRGPGTPSVGVMILPGFAQEVRAEPLDPLEPPGALGDG